MARFTACFAQVNSRCVTLIAHSMFDQMFDQAGGDLMTLNLTGPSKRPFVIQLGDLKGSNRA
jgi:hypothetical protein